MNAKDDTPTAAAAAGFPTDTGRVRLVVSVRGRESFEVLLSPTHARSLAVSLVTAASEEVRHVRRAD